MLLFMMGMSGADPEGDCSSLCTTSPLTQPDSHNPTAGTAGQHGLDHPTVFLKVPWLECECKFSHGSSGREIGGEARSIDASGCAEEGEVYWIVSLSGLVPGFVYECHFQCIVEEADTNTHYMWKLSFSTDNSSYTVRQPLSDIRHESRGLNWDRYIPKKDPFVIWMMDVTVVDMHPGLTSEEALIGKMNRNSHVNPFHVRCVVSDSGERTNVPEDRGEDKWQYNVMQDDTRLFGFVPSVLSVGRNDICSRTSAYRDRDLKTAINSGTTISMSQLDRGGTEKGEPNACTGDSADTLCSILSAVSLNNQERDDCGRGRDSEQASYDLQGSGSGGETLQQLISLPSHFPSYLSSSFFPPPRPTNSKPNSKSNVDAGWEEHFNVTAVLNPWHRPGVENFSRCMCVLFTFAKKLTFFFAKPRVIPSAAESTFGADISHLSGLDRHRCFACRMLAYAGVC